MFVQSPASAKFDAMPRSVIDAGRADVVAPVEELASRIAAYHARVRHAIGSDTALPLKTHNALEKSVLW